MNTELIRQNLDSKKGKVLKFRYNKARNQTEEFKGTIENTYSRVFIIKTDDDNDQVRAFCYSDILTNNLEILTKKI